MTPATAPLEDDDLLSEILLRLPPQPSSLPRASAVCKRWLGLVSSPGFVRRFRFRHRRNPPVLGLLRQVFADGALRFEPTMEAPNRVPRGRFSLQIDGCMLLGCRHGLVLALHASLGQVIVWDPVTRGQHRAAAPPGFDMAEVPIDGTVLRDAGDHFQVVLLGYEQELNPQVVVCFYSSETGVWSNLIQTPVPEDTVANDVIPVLAGDSLYWLLHGTGDSSVVLEFDLDRKSLAVIEVPTDMFTEDLMVMRAEGGALGLLSMSGYRAQLWKRNIDGDGVSSWVLGRTIELDRLLTLDDSNGVIKHVQMIAYAEENNVVFLRTVAGIFMVQLESLKFNKLLENNDTYVVSYPLESVYAAGI